MLLLVQTELGRAYLDPVSLHDIFRMRVSLISFEVVWQLVFEASTSKKFLSEANICLSIDHLDPNKVMCNRIGKVM